MRFLFPILLLIGCHAATGQTQVDLENYRAASIKRWDKDIQKLETRDRDEKHPANSILFVGSSSIRLWKTIATDMAPYHPIQRGFGGCRWSDVAVFADRLITPHKFRAVAFFVANDITGGDGDKSPEEIAALFEHVWQRTRKHNPTAPVFYIAVTPTSSRWKAWPAIRKGNETVQKFCESKDNTWFIGTESVYLGADGKPLDDLFVGDRLHLNPGGYTRWAAAIKSHLDSVLGGADSQPARSGTS